MKRERRRWKEGEEEERRRWKGGEEEERRRWKGGEEEEREGGEEEVMGTAGDINTKQLA